MKGPQNRIGGEPTAATIPANTAVESLFSLRGRRAIEWFGLIARSASGRTNRARRPSPPYNRVTLALTPGTRLGVYEVTALLGEGGMGQVYRATDTKLKRQVAIKILAPSVGADTIG